jgi:hypothetical protein
MIIAGLWQEIVAAVILRGLRELFRFLFWVPVYPRNSRVK